MICIHIFIIRILCLVTGKLSKKRSCKIYNLFSHIKQFSSLLPRTITRTLVTRFIHSSSLKYERIHWRKLNRGSTRSFISTICLQFFPLPIFPFFQATISIITTRNERAAFIIYPHERKKKRIKERLNQVGVCIPCLNVQSTLTSVNSRFCKSVHKPSKR